MRFLVALAPWCLIACSAADAPLAVRSPDVAERGVPIDAGQPADAHVALDAAPDHDASDAGDARATGRPRWALTAGPDVPPAVVERARALLGGAPAGAEADSVVALGEVPLARALIADAELAEPGVAVVRVADVDGRRVHAVRGGAAGSHALRPGASGVGYGTYRLLEALGFAFLHPLAPVSPPVVEPLAAGTALRAAPRWPVRGLQLHTMHPTELADLLNGWGPRGPDDRAGWEAMLPEWDRYLEWLVANGQDRTHWMPLAGESWMAFALGDERLRRLAVLVARAHDFGIAAGVDVPIALHQQHAFRMVVDTGDLAAERAQIEARVVWLLGAGFDYVATENGSTEFTHGDATRMLAWLDAFTAAVADRGKRAYVKIHTSSGQTAEPFVDPDTGGPLNYNFLPHYADPRLGVMPHTLQLYALDDPAPTYGHQDFSEIRRFIRFEAGTREVVWHAETAYWVSYDVDVPLFLPLYAERRFHDLRLIAADEAAGVHPPIDGQLTFSSGWEWGYWLSDVVAARAAVDPRPALPERAALTAILSEALAVFGPARADVVALLLDTMDAERALLIDGRVGGVAPADVERRNGQAYLQGAEAFDDLADLTRHVPGVPHFVTQPDRLGLVEMRAALHAPPRYTQELRPLLVEMARRLRALGDRWPPLAARVPAHALPLFEDLADAAEITALRAEQVLGLYDAVDLRAEDPPRAAAALAAARLALDRAAGVVARREPRYRVPADRVASWRDTPTAYEFGYLWTVRHLYYWWRDELKAVEAPRSPCVLNVIAPADVVLGEGLWLDLSRLVRDLSALGAVVEGVGECLAPPRAEPTLPPPGLRP